MRYLLLLGWLLPMMAMAQKSRKAKARQQADSFYRLQLSYMDKFGVMYSGYHGPMVPDTLYYPNQAIKAIGAHAVDKAAKQSNYKVGPWVHYYPTGRPMCRGTYQMHHALGCCSATFCLLYRSYKIGHWAYYYENGQVMAVGTYQLVQTLWRTGVAKQYAYLSKIGDDWLLYEPDGQPATDRNKIIAAIGEMERP